MPVVVVLSRQRLAAVAASSSIAVADAAQLTPELMSGLSHHVVPLSPVHQQSLPVQPENMKSAVTLNNASDHRANRPLSD